MLACMNLLFKTNRDVIDRTGIELKMKSSLMLRAKPSCCLEMKENNKVNLRKESQGKKLTSFSSKESSRAEKYLTDSRVRCSNTGCPNFEPFKTSPTLFL